ncbi:MAG: phosphoethanolamine--lipid A transferase EptA [Alistipes sp.]|nr:phosphoethanolamine--lipid A transferase EptA [Alistipes sp.]
MRRLFHKPVTLTLFSIVLSLFTLVAFHKPLLDLVLECVERDFNGWVLVVSIMLLTFVANFMVYYLLLYLCRIVGRIIISILVVANSVALYFVNTYEVLLTRDMMGNLFNTNISEASGFISFTPIIYVTLLGVVPSIYIVRRAVEYGTLKRMFLNVGVSLVAILLIGAINMGNILWIDHNAPRVGSLFMPWSYIANTVRHFNHQRMLNRKAISLPDAVITNSEREVCVLVIGESARRGNFSLYGYERDTNPLLEKDSVTTYNAIASATSTTAAVKAILSHKASGKLYEILPNYMERSGVDVVWRSTNWGEPPLHIEKRYNLSALAKRYPDADERYDGLLLAGLKDEIESSEAEKLLIVLHTSTSHGPTYFKKYPAEFEKYSPVCTTVEMAKADPQELMNAYDNTILYTDFLLHSVIEVLRSVERPSSMIYISDHGESLGEGNMYMHGMLAASMAPREQLEIPFIVWQSDNGRELKALDEVGHYHIFHSIMDYLDLRSDIYDEQKSIFN